MTDTAAIPSVQDLDKDVDAIISKYGVNAVKYTIMHSFEGVPDYRKTIQEVEGRYGLPRRAAYTAARRVHINELTIASFNRVIGSSRFRKS